MATLVEELAIDDPNELKRLTAGMKFDQKKICKLVVLHEYTYEQAGEIHGVTKQAVHKCLKKVYQKKYGVEYGKKE